MRKTAIGQLLPKIVSLVQLVLDGKPLQLAIVYCFGLFIHSRQCTLVHVPVLRTGHNFA
jgi:hypothetical protein